MQNGLVIASLRTNHKLTQLELAKLLDVSLSTYKLYEADIQPMKLEEINTLSNYFHVSLNYLMSLSDKPKSYNFQKEIDYSYLKFSFIFWRKRNRINQKTMAKEFGISYTTLSSYEKEPEKAPITFIYRFAKKFNVSIDYICGKSLKKEVL